MTISEKKEKIEQIEKTIKRHEYNFYVLGQKTITSAELEVLKVELYNLKHMRIDTLPQEPTAANTGESSFEFYDGI